MKQLKLTLLLFVCSALFSSTSFARSNEVEHFGLSDSCWQVFLSQLDNGDSSLGDYMDSLSKLDGQIDSLMKLIPELKGKGVKQLQKRIIAMRKASHDLKKAINDILKENIDLLIDVRETCGQDTTVDDTTVDDTTNDTTSVDSLVIGLLNPNPATSGGSVNLPVTLVATMDVTVELYDQSSATLVRTYTFAAMPSGTTTVSLDLTGVPAGSYVVRVRAGTSSETANLLIL